MPGPGAANLGQAGGRSGGAGAAEREEPNRYVPMHLRARDDRQTRADYGDIDKPGGEITDNERHPDLDDAIDIGVALLRNFRSSPDVLGAIKTHIESYMETGRFQAIPDPEVDIEQAPQAAPNEPQDDAPISQTHFYRVRTFVNTIEEHYGGHLHNADNERRIHDILRKYCNKIKTIPGCLLAKVNFADISRLIDMLQHLQQLSMEIKNKIFPEDIIKDKFLTLIKQEKYLDDAEELKQLFSHVIEQLRVMISVPHVDLLSFMGDSKSVVTFTIQARLVAKGKVEIDRVKTEDFLHKFDDHEDLKAPLREILEQQTMSQVEFEKLSLLSGKEPGASFLGAVGGADLPKPGLLTPPPASSETEIPKTSEKEIEIRLPVKSKYIDVYNLCREFGVISEIREMKSSPGTFTVAFEQKSSAEKALTSLEKENSDVKMARVTSAVYYLTSSNDSIYENQGFWRSAACKLIIAELSGRPPLSETTLYMGNRTMDQEMVFDMAAQFSGFDKKSSMTRTNPLDEGFARLTYKTHQDATSALEGFQKMDLGGAYVTRAFVPSETARSLSGALKSSQSSVDEPPQGQLPTLYFSKLPGEEMTYPDCENYLSDLVGSIVQPETIIRVNVTRTYGDSGMSFRHGFCTLKSLEDCKFVISKLKGRVKSIAKGYEQSWLYVNWANGQ